MSKTARICIIPYLSGIGGMVSFQRRLADGLQLRGVSVAYSLDDAPYQAVLVIGGSRQVGKLWRARRRGIPIIQRLDGMNWVHRVRRTGIRHYLRAEYGNMLLTWIRDRLASRVIYQSRFSRRWWEEKRSPARAPSNVIYNGVDLETYTPEGPQTRPEDRVRILLVEGSLMGGYDFGLQNAIRLGETIEQMKSVESLPAGGAGKVELMVVGRASQPLRAHWESRTRLPIRWMGLVPPEVIPDLDRSAHLLFSADINPACPNAVIEALACGTPVVAFATGALDEIVVGDAGRLASYGADPWKLEDPDIPALARKAREVLDDQEAFRAAARAQAKAHFDLDRMVDRYLELMCP